MFNFRTGVREKRSLKEKPGKNQHPYYQGRARGADFLAPSSIKEVGRGEAAANGKATDYWVEVGATIEPVRYFRSFFSALSGNTTWFGMLSQLFQGDFGEGDLDTAIHVHPADPNRMLYELSREIAGKESDLYGEKNTIKRAMLMQELSDLHEQQKRIRMNVERLFHVSIQVCSSSTSLEKFKRFNNALVKRFAGQGIFLRGADLRQRDALMAMTPLGGNPFRDTFRNMESSNVADMFPFGHGGINHKTGIIIGIDPEERPVFFDNWHPALTNYNGVIFGQSGFGKTFAIMLFTGRSALAGIRTAIIDPEGEYKALVKALGCPYIDLSHQSGDRINIFDVEEEFDGTYNSVNLEETIKAAQAAVYKMIRLVDPEALSGEVKLLIREQIIKLYRDRGITENPESLYEPADDMSMERRKKEMPTLSDLCELMTEDERLGHASRVLRTFTGKGVQGIFDCRSTLSIGDAPVFAICLGGLDKDVMKPLGSFIATKWIWEKFVKKNPGIKKRVIVDEAQIMMDEPGTAKWLENSFRRARKRNCGMWAVTQGFEVFLRVPQGMGILKNAPCKLLMRQEAIDIDAVQGKFNLSEGEAHFLLTAPKGFGILRADTKASVVRIKATEHEAALFSSREEAGHV